MFLIDPPKKSNVDKGFKGTVYTNVVKNAVTRVGNAPHPTPYYSPTLSYRPIPSTRGIALNFEFEKMQKTAKFDDLTTNFSQDYLSAQKSRTIKQLNSV